MRRWLLFLPLLLSGVPSCKQPPLHIESRGRGPAIVFIHGGLLDSRIWDAELAFFSGQYLAVRYDLRGSGKSPKAKEKYSHVEDLANVLDSVGADSAHLVGLSFGGRIAIDFALTYPERTRSLVLLAPGLSGYTFSTEHEHRLHQLFVDTTVDGFTKKWLSDPYMAPAMENTRLAPWLRMLTAENARKRLTGPAEAAADWPRPEAALRLKSLAPPVLLFVGDRDVPDVKKIAELLEAQVPRTRVIHLPGVGHLVHLEAPQPFAETTARFLKALP